MATEFEANHPSEVVGCIVSRLDYPVTVDYGAEKLRLSARGRTYSTLIKSLLGPLPAGVVFVAK